MGFAELFDQGEKQTLETGLKPPGEGVWYQCAQGMSVSDHATKLSCMGR